MVYMGGDNNLEGQLAPDLQEMEQVGTGPNLHIVVQVDDQTGQAALPNVPFRAEIKKDPAAGVGSATANIPEPNMGASATLAGFITWAVQNHPADNYVLVIWNHGAGWRGVVEDKSHDDGVGTTGDDWLGMDELTAGLLVAPLELRVIAFDACLMAELEVARQVWAFADVMVASQDCVDGTGYPYNTMLQALETNPGWTGEQLAADMVDKYAAEYAGTPFTLSAIRLNLDLLDLVAAVSQLGSDLRTGVDDFNAHLNSADNVQIGIKDARAAAHEPILNCGRTLDIIFSLLGCPRAGAAVDLLDFTRKVNGEARIDAAYKGAIPNVQAKLGDVIINEAHGADHNGGPTPKANGLSLYFPQTQLPASLLDARTTFDGGSGVGTLYSANPDWDAGDNLPALPNHPLPPHPPQPGFRFPEVTQWDEFLFRFYKPVADAGPDVKGTVGQAVTLDGRGSSDSDGAIPPANHIWDFKPGVDTGGDLDKDGPDETDDDADATGQQVQFPCATAGVFTVRLIVRDNHENVHNGNDPNAPRSFRHFQVDDDSVNVTCNEPPVGGVGFFPEAAGSSGPNAGVLAGIAAGAAAGAVALGGAWYVRRRWLHR